MDVPRSTDLEGILLLVRSEVREVCSSLQVLKVLKIPNFGSIAIFLLMTH